MDETRQGDLFYADGEDREGVFDAQLSLPFPFAGPPAPFTTLIKRDGREEFYDKTKIASAIFKAAQSIGGQDYDLALSLASAVTIYLTKRLGDEPPTVDQVHDAVERVLIQMGHARTALTYARYRDRRARIRRLREGDMRALLSELQQAASKRDEQEAEASLFVRTSSETLAAFDRDRIAKALQRETGLDEATALLIALEVEKQIESAQITTLTTSLVRELVDAKLIEHGLEAIRHHHRRLGVPLFDTERIIRGTAPETVAQDPVATDQVLARAVKKEYALSQIFSAPIAEAHLRGELHLHHLDRADRLFTGDHSAEWLTRFGVGMPGSRQFCAPPDAPESFLAQLVQCGSLLQGFFAGPVVWEAINIFWAPFLQGYPEKDLGEFARVFLYEQLFRHLRHGGQEAPAVLRLHWTAPAWLREVDAVGMDGAPMGMPYDEFTHTYQQFAWRLLEAVAEGDAQGDPLPAPIIEVVLGPDFQRAEGSEAFLQHAAKIAAKHRNLRFRLERRAHDADVLLPWQMRRAAWHQISLNLPRAAYETGKEAALLERLTVLIKLAAEAHREKRDFLEGLLDAQGNGPLAWLAREYDGHAYADPNAARFLIAVDGLNECLQTLLNTDPAESGEAQALGRRILAHLHERCTAESQAAGLTLVLAQNNDTLVSERFAQLDAQTLPKTVGANLPHGNDPGALTYTPGVRLAVAAALSPVERGRIEGGFHEYLRAGASTDIRLPQADLSGDAITGFLQKLLRQTPCQQVTFRP